MLFRVATRSAPRVARQQVARKYATVPPPGPGPTTQAQSNNLLYVGGGVAALGLGYYFFMADRGGAAKGKMNELEGKAKGMASRAEGKAHEVMGQAKGEYKEAMGEAKKALK